MRRIVVPLTFSRNSANAARYAADLAKTIGAELNLVYVLHAPEALSRRPMPEFLYQELRDSGFQLLHDIAKELRTRAAGKVEVSTDLEIGEVPEKLKSFCGQQRPFLVVMGAGEHPLDDGVESSHTVKAMHRLPYPLLVIPEGAEFHGVGKIVIASDQEDIFSGMSTVLPFLKEVGGLLGAKFEIVHVVTNGESVTNVLSEYDSWRKAMPAFEPELHLIRQPRVEEGIDQYLHEHPADWLLVLPKRHAMLEFHKSRAKDIVLRCGVPVVSLHE